MAHDGPASAVIQPKRYRRIIAFAAGVLGQTVWWDGVFAFPLLDRLRPPPLKRWQAIARRYRDIATEMGGVLIKLGQFLSTRVDLFPPEITRELASLQDEADPAPFAGVAAMVEASFQRPLPSDAEDALSAEAITAVLASRVRCTDEVGWIGERAIGALLPETHGPGAWLFAEKVLRSACCATMIVRNN